jgi:hypothetical protein
MAGLNLREATAAIYNKQWTLRRPPHIVLLPRMLPLSRLNGASPARAATCLRLSVPSSGRYAMRAGETLGPTPGML